jgi:alkanesulfonate monooxygenase SsuD/methylene tetrahydromethanopterin reductase-like flavin-dependent oxidoreductase (luciferase family)
LRFYINILTTYYPDLDPPYDVYYQQILEQIELAEELGWECFMFNEHHFLGYGGLVANPAVLLAAAAVRTSRHPARRNQKIHAPFRQRGHPAFR